MAFAHLAFVYLSDAINSGPGQLGPTSGRSANFVLNAFPGVQEAVSAIPYVFFREWLMPFMPVSIGVFVALFIRSTRRTALFTVAGVFLYIVAAAAVLHLSHERGAYLLPLAWFGATLTIQLVNRKWRPALLVVALVLLINNLGRLGSTKSVEEIALGCRQAAGDQPIAFLPVTFADSNLRYVWLADAEAIYLYRWLLLKPKFLPDFILRLDDQIRALVEEGHAAVMTCSGRDFLHSDDARALSTGAPTFAEHFDSNYELIGFPSENPVVWRVYLKERADLPSDE